MSEHQIVQHEIDDETVYQMVLSTSNVRIPDDVDDFNTSPAPSMALQDLIQSKNDYMSSADFLNKHSANAGEYVGKVQEPNSQDVPEDKSASTKQASQPEPLSIPGVCTFLDIHSRICTGSFHMMLAIDRLACPIPEYKNVHIERMFDACKDFPRWSSSLAPQQKKDVLSVLTDHIKKTSQYLQNNK